MVPVIHAVTTDEIVARPEFLDRATSVMRALGPRGAVQLRAPRTTGRRLHEVASSLAVQQESTGAWLIVTDRVDVAVAVGARGVQLTSRSIGVADALTFGPRLAIGASAHSLAEARAACDARATWLVVGQLRDEPPGAAGPRALRELASECGVPVIVIGGVTPGHVRGLRRLGVYGVAAIRGVWDAESAAEAANHYLAAHDDAAATA
jgi:thiazole tautomerase (transcriptional regulator TenI)